jgi:hypothetical protein
MTKILVAVLLLTATSLRAAEPIVLSIWPGLAPIGAGDSEKADGDAKSSDCRW